MLKNIYAPLSGGIAQERTLEVLSNNIANANTTGYKEDHLSFQSMLPKYWDSYPSPLPPALFKQDMQEIHPLRGNEMEYVAIGDMKTDHTQGALKQTHNTMDLALEGNGFFAIDTPFGERYTRDGSFTLSKDGLLTTKNGAVVQGENGPIGGLEGGNFTVNPKGEVYVGDQYIDRLKVVTFEDPKALQKLGSNLWIHDGDPENMQASTSRVAQGYLEGSNVNPIRNLTALITAHRTYEAMQKAIKSHDESMALSATKIGEGK